MNFRLISNLYSKNSNSIKSCTRYKFKTTCTYTDTGIAQIGTNSSFNINLNHYHLQRHFTDQCRSGHGRQTQCAFNIRGYCCRNLGSFSRIDTNVPVKSRTIFTSSFALSSEPTVNQLNNENEKVLPGVKRIDFLPLDTSFNSSEEAYKSKSTAELARALFVFQLTSFDPLVKHNIQILKFLRRIFGKRLFHYVMEHSFYGHFVAGADLHSIKPVISRNMQYGVKSILDYSVEEDMEEEQAKNKTKMSYDEIPMEGSLVSQSTGSLQYEYHEKFGDRRKDVVSARTYFYDSEAQCNKNMMNFLECIDVVKETTDGTGFAAIKLTALGRPKFLLNMSRVLTGMKETFEKLTAKETDIVLKRIRSDMLSSSLTHMGIPVSRDDSKQWFTWLDVSDQGEIDLYTWSNLLKMQKPLHNFFTVPNLEEGKLESVLPRLSPESDTELKNMLERINKIAEHAADSGVRVLVDAEQTYFQPAISRLTMEMMRNFNKEKAVVFNTYQCYLKNAHDNFIIDLDLARRENFHFGCKVVRGAYMDQERERAVTIGYEDPINVSFEATTAMYEKVIDTAMKEVKLRQPGAVAVMAATHNEDTVRYCVQKLKDLGIKREDKAICFGQLLGMCDHVSFPLASFYRSQGQSGYSVYKYVPYGPIDEVLPYLSRRAMENRGILAKVKKEKKLLRAELKNRLLPNRGGNRQSNVKL